MMTTLTDMLEPLRAADRSILRIAGTARTLNPDGCTATSLEQLGQDILPGCDPEIAHVFVRGFSDIAEAIVDNFPETLFWDLDFMASEILRQDDPGRIEQLCADLTQLQLQYGRHSVLAFRYVHDFTYGYDWAKWVMREPEERRDVRPFDPAFIAYLQRRGEELVTLIERNDAKYPKLPHGRSRNPFGFSREPAHEALLFSDLAARGLLPVRGWDVEARPVAGRPFAELRVDLARRLGVPMRESHGG
jgi:hypothetical protein